MIRKIPLFKGKEGRGDFRKNSIFYLRNKFSSMSNNPYRMITLLQERENDVCQNHRLSRSSRHLHHDSIMMFECLLNSLHHVLLIIKKLNILRHFRLIVCVFPVIPVTTAIPLSRISTFSYLASTITFPFNVITPQCWGICSKAQ